MAAPKAVNWSATTEGDSWHYAFRVITPGGHEFTERRAETIASWKGKKRDDPEAVGAAYAALKDHVERQVDELDGPATEGSLTLGEKGEVTGLGEAAEVETVESLRARIGATDAAIDQTQARLVAAVAEKDPALAEEVRAMIERARQEVADAG